MDKLKPCPFCGGEAEWNEKNKALGVRGAKRQFHLLAVFFENIFDKSGCRQYMAGLWNRRADNG